MSVSRAEVIPVLEHLLTPEIAEQKSVKLRPSAIDFSEKYTEGDHIEEENGTISTEPKYKHWRVNRQLIPLKISLFFYYGGSLSANTFVSLFLKQRGTTLAQLSVMYFAATSWLLFYQPILGYVSDKTKKPKAIALAHIFLNFTFVGCMLIVATGMKIDEKSIKCRNTTIDCTYMNISSGSLLCENYNSTSSMRNKDQIDNAEFNGSLEGCLKIESHKSLESDDLPWFLILILFFATLRVGISSSAFRCFDFISMSMTKQLNSDYGMQRGWAVLGSMVMSFTIGYIVQVFTPLNSQRNCEAAMYTIMMCLLLSLASLWGINVSYDPSYKPLWKEALFLLRKVETYVFALLLFVCGTGYALDTYYSAYYLDDLEASSFLLGLIESIKNVMGLGLMLTSRWWIQKLGTNFLCLFALVCYVTINIGYSYLTDPWWALLYCLPQAISYHLFWVAALNQAQEIATENLQATVTFVVGTIHFSFSRISASVLGGFFMSKYGARFTYRGFAAICGTTAMIYAGFTLYSSRTQRKERQRRNPTVSHRI